MASKLTVVEYAGLVPQQLGSVIPIPMEPPLAEQQVDFSGGVAQSSAFNAKTRIIRICGDSACRVLVGTNPTATTTSGRLAAGSTDYRGIPEGVTFKISAIAEA